LRVKYSYAGDGHDRLGRKLPDIPVLWVELLLPTKHRIGGPCIIDTGFDGGIFANEDLVLFLEGISPTRTDELYALGGREIRCQVFSVKGRLMTESGERLHDLGAVDIYVPLVPEELSAEVVVGREVLNRLSLGLDGKEVKVFLDRRRASAP
jgi:hypothetical protein